MKISLTLKNGINLEAKLIKGVESDSFMLTLKGESIRTRAIKQVFNFEAKLVHQSACPGKYLNGWGEAISGLAILGSDSKNKLKRLAQDAKDFIESVIIPDAIAQIEKYRDLATLEALHAYESKLNVTLSAKKSRVRTLREQIADLTEAQARNSKDLDYFSNRIKDANYLEGLKDGSITSPHLEYLKEHDVFKN